MSIIVKDTGSGDFQIPDSGIQNAVCSNVYDLGLQPGFQGKVQHKVAILWELEQTITEGEYAGKRFVVSQIYTASLGEKANLRAHLESWRGRSFTEAELEGFDIERLRGIPCLLSIVHNEKNSKTYANVSAVLKHDKRYDAMLPELERDYVPKWIADKIAAQMTADEAPQEPQDNSGQGGSEFEDDVPF